MVKVHRGVVADELTRYTPLLAVWDGIIPLLVCYLMMAYFNRIPLLSDALRFIGVHSMNVFLVHNFIRIMWYYDFTYSFTHWLAITAVLLAISLAISVVLEAAKRLIRFDSLVARLRDSCERIS